MPITLAHVAEARANIAAVALRTPLVRCYANSPATAWLKLEDLQPIGAIAAGLSRRTGNVAAVVSGGNIDLEKFAQLTASCGRMEW